MVLDQPALIPQAMDGAWGVIPQGLMGSPLIVEFDVTRQRGSRDLQGGIGGVEIDLLLLDRAIPSLLAGIVGGTIGPAGREDHRKIPDQPFRSAFQIGRSPVCAEQGFGMLSFHSLAHIGQSQKILDFPMGDRGDDPPGDDIPGEAIDDRQQVMPHAGDVQEGPIFSPDLVGTEGFVMGRFPGSLS